MPNQRTLGTWRFRLLAWIFDWRHKAPANLHRSQTGKGFPAAALRRLSQAKLKKETVALKLVDRVPPTKNEGLYIGQ